MIVDQYFSEPNGRVCFTREQGSNFAKHMAGDFNPLHDADARRFCIPGDLLFSVVLAKYGVSQHMEFDFSGMVLEGVELVLPKPSAELKIQDTEKRDYLQVRRGGDLSRDETLLQSLTQEYVEFSGKSFPHILVPLLAEQNVMINAQRPLIIYQSMSLQLDQLNLNNPTLKLSQTTLKIDGKRGDAHLHFDVLDGATLIGRGVKHLILSGLRPFEQGAVDIMVSDYLGWQSEHSYL